MFVGVLAGLLLVGGTAWFVHDWLKGGHINEVAERLPDDTLVLFSARGFADLFLEFEDEIDQFDDLRKVSDNIEDLEESLGLNPLDPKDLQSTGFSFGSPWALAVLGDIDDDDVDAVFLIPVEDAEAVEDFLIEIGKELDLDIDDEEIEDLPGWTVENEHNETEAFALVLDDDYLIACVPLGFYADDDDMLDDSVECLEELIQLDDKDTLAELNLFQDAIDLIDNDWHFLSYVNSEVIETAIEENREPGVPDEFYRLAKDLVDLVPATVSTITIEREEIRIEALMMTDSEYAHLFSMDGEDDLASRIPGEPLAVARSSIQLLPLWNIVSEWKGIEEPLDDILDKVEDQLDVDVEEELIQNFTGHFGQVILKSDGKGRFFGDYIFYAPVEDANIAMDALENITEGFEDRYPQIDIDEEQLEDGLFYMLEDTAAPSLCWGQVAEHIVAAISGSGECSDIMEDIEDGDETFLDELPNRVEDGLENGPAFYAYLDVGTLIDVIEDQTTLRGQEEDIADAFEDLISGVEVSIQNANNHKRFTLNIIPQDDDFGPGIESWVKLFADFIEPRGNRKSTQKSADVKSRPAKR